MLAGLWAAVLIPATRGTRSATYDGRSMHGFHTAMRVLSRRAAPADTRYIMMPTAAVTAVPAGRKVRERRRRVFVRLLWAAGLSLVAAVFLGGPWPVLHVLADVATLAYAARLRRIALTEATAARSARREQLARHEAEQRAAYEATRRVPVPERDLAPVYVRTVQLPAYPAATADPAEAAGPQPQRRAAGE